MKRIMIAGVLALGAVTAHAEPVQLASLGNVDGKILVNKGKGFVTAKAGMPLAEGDRIIALHGSRAAVVYPDGCVTQLGENSLLAMDKGVGCKAEPVRTGTQPPIRVAQAIGGTRNDGRDDNRNRGYPPGAVVPWALWGLAGGSLIIDAATNNNRNDQPISGQ